MVEVLPASCGVGSRTSSSELSASKPSHLCATARQIVTRSGTSSKCKACSGPLGVARSRSRKFLLLGTPPSAQHPVSLYPPASLSCGDYRTNGARPEQQPRNLAPRSPGKLRFCASWLPRAGLSCTLWSSMKDAALLLLVGSIGQCQRSAAGLLVPNRGSNPSVEGTSTSKLRLLAAAPHVKR